MSKIRFRIIPPVDRPEAKVFIAGSHRDLGSWDPAKAMPLDFDGVFHNGSIEADTGSHVEYKITRGSWESEAVEAFGHVPANSRHEIWLDATLQHTVADWKDRYCGRLTRERLHSRILAGGNLPKHRNFCFSITHF